MSKKKEDFSFIIEEQFGCLKQSEEHGWAKNIVKIIWGDNPPSIDIRNMNISQNKVGKGISLTNEECDKMVDILLNNDYGSIDEIKKALERRKHIYTIAPKIEDIVPVGHVSIEIIRGDHKNGNDF